MTARYDAIAAYYDARFSDADPVMTYLLDVLGSTAGSRVLDLACGAGRVTRALARAGAVVTGVDLSRALLDRAEAAEAAEPLGITYTHLDAAGPAGVGEAEYDAVVCNFGLSDIDDLDGAIANVARALCPTGRFVFSILHPCFPGGEGVSGDWPASGRYYDERWWMADGVRSTLRRQVGANHRMLSTYVNVLRGHGLVIDEMREPDPGPKWAADGRGDSARFPVYLVIRCAKLDVRPETGT